MKLTKESLNKYIELYLNDIEDYGTQDEKILAESVLRPYSQLITENTDDTFIFIKESLKFVDPQNKEIVENFIEYVETA